MDLCDKHPKVRFQTVYFPTQLVNALYLTASSVKPDVYTL